MRKTFFILGLVAGVPPAGAALPTAGYVSDFLETMCHNPDLIVPGAGINELVSQKYLFGLIDELNKNNINFFTGEPFPTSYLSGLTTNYVISTGYLKDSMRMLTDSVDCCLGGVLIPNTRNCISCGEWSVSTDDACPSGYYAVKLENAYMTDVGETCSANQGIYMTVSDLCTEYIH